MPWPTGQADWGYETIGDRVMSREDLQRQMSGEIEDEAEQEPLQQQQQQQQQQQAAAGGGAPRRQQYYQAAVEMMAGGQEEWEGEEEEEWEDEERPPRVRWVDGAMEQGEEEGAGVLASER